MTESQLLVCFILLSFIALSMALIPLRRHKVGMILMASVLIGLVGLAYWSWGGWPLLQGHVQHLAQQERMQAMLKSVKGPQELIGKLKAHLKKTPGSAKGWYLLGRLYASQNQWDLAFDAFNTAHQIKPNDELITVNLAQSLLASQDKTENDQGRVLLIGVLQKNPNQPDAIAMLAMDAYTHHDYQRAIDYWQHLLELAPAHSEAAEAIRKAIAKAQLKQGVNDQRH